MSLRMIFLIWLSGAAKLKLEEITQRVITGSDRVLELHRKGFEINGDTPSSFYGKRLCLEICEMQKRTDWDFKIMSFKKNLKCLELLKHGPQS